MTSRALTLPVVFLALVALPLAASTPELAEPAPLDVFTGPAIQPGQEFDVSAYYPVKIGSYWKYQDLSENNVQFKLEIKKTVPANGVNANLFERSTRVETDGITVGADGIVLHVQERTNSGTVMKTLWTPPVKFADLKTKFGNRCTTTPGFLNPGTGNKMTWVSTVIGSADVTVPAGKFTNAVRIKVLVTDSVLGVKLCDFEMWVAHGVGVVQRQGNFFGVYFVQKMLEWKVAAN